MTNVNTNKETKVKAEKKPRAKAQPKVVAETPVVVAEVKAEPKKNEMTADQMELLLGGAMPVFDEPTKADRPASEKQYQYYCDLCRQKHVDPADITTLTSISINAEINRLKELPYWQAVSDKQKERITEYCTALGMKLPDFDKLNGAYGASASNMMQLLKERMKNVVLPATEKQLAMITQMQFCPACESVENAEAMSQTEASEYISKFKDEFYGWKKTRLSPDQAKLIQILTARMGDELSYTQIIQFDEGTASKYIDQLEKELADKSLTESTLEPEEMRGIVSRDHNDEERTQLRALIANLYASLGQAIEEEVYETLEWNSLKDLVELSKMYGNDVVAMFEGLTVFTEDQKTALTA